MRTFLKHLGAALISAPLALVAEAHDGHGIAGTHWHAAEVAPYLAMAVAAVALGLWLTRQK